jgi:hypothetical protein
LHVVFEKRIVEIVRPLGSRIVHDDRRRGGLAFAFCRGPEFSHLLR